jgi:hypothetical protein
MQGIGKIGSRRTSVMAQKRSLICLDPTGMMSSDKSRMVLTLELSLRPSKDKSFSFADGGHID